MTLSELRQYLRYDPDTGVFTWINPPPNYPKLRGKAAGTVTSHGYIAIAIKRQRIYLGRFRSPQLAGNAYIIARRRHFGEFCPQ